MKNDNSIHNNNSKKNKVVILTEMFAQLCQLIGLNLKNKISYKRKD